MTRNHNLQKEIENQFQLLPSKNGGKKVFRNSQCLRTQNVIIKNARGHLFYEIGEPMFAEPVDCTFEKASLLSEENRDSFENITYELWPEVGSRLIDRLLRQKDLSNGWVIVQPNVYRYAVMYHGSELVIRTVILENLATEVIWSS
ncbi:hypothetical protein ACMAY7_02120 [Rhodobacteraceae bacterium nBUS_24]